MKTNQEMVRYIDSFSVVQRTSDGYFDGTELLRQWNNVEGNPRRQMSKFLESDNTSEFLKALAEDESHRAKMLIGENQLLIKVKGRNTKEGKTPDKVWMNPLLFKELGSAVQKIVPKEFMPKAMQKVGEALNWVVFNSHEKMLRNKQGDESKQRELWQLEKKVADLINEGFITNFDNLISYLRKQYSKRNYPAVFQLQQENTNFIHYK